MALAGHHQQPLASQVAEWLPWPDSLPQVSSCNLNTRTSVWLRETLGIGVSPGESIRCLYSICCVLCIARGLCTL